MNRYTTLKIITAVSSMGMAAIGVYCVLTSAWIALGLVIATYVLTSLRNVISDGERQRRSLRDLEALVLGTKKGPH